MANWMGQTETGVTALNDGSHTRTNYRGTLASQMWSSATEISCGAARGQWDGPGSDNLPMVTSHDERPETKRDQEGTLGFP